MKAITIYFVFAVVLLLCGNAIYAQDAAKVSPDKVKVLLDNDRVRVLEFTLKPGEETGMHSHPDYLIYPLVDGKTMTTFTDDKSSEEMVVKAGEVRFSEGVTHNNKNVGETETHAIVIELKDSK